jgi:hypothetical protein
MYIPQNRIITNQFAYSGQFIYKNSQKPYSGYYWKSYDGSYYTGKTPNEKPNDEIEPINQTSNNTTNNSTSQIAVTEIPSYYSQLNVGSYSDTLISEYTSIKKININTDTSKQVPNSYFPKPSQDDYNIGSFTRYFLAKINENTWIEVDSPTYNAISSQSNSWLWELFIPVSLTWTLTGNDELSVYKINQKIVVLTEQRLKRKGLALFLKLNFAQFFQKS